MTTLPPRTPKWLIWAANFAVIAIMTVLGLFAKSIDIKYVVGYLVGFFVLYIAVRLKHGFWPFND